MTLKLGKPSTFKKIKVGQVFAFNQGRQLFYKISWQSAMKIGDICKDTTADIPGEVDNYWMPHHDKMINEIPEELQQLWLTK